MNGLPTANEMAIRLIRLSEKLDTGADALKRAEAAHLVAKMAHGKAYALAVLKVAADNRGDKSVLAAEREAMAATATTTEWFDLQVAESAVRQAKEDLRITYTNCDLARSLNAGLKVDAQLAGVRGA